MGVVACSIVVSIMSLGATTTAWAGTPVFASVAFHGSSTQPVVVLQGAHFGTTPSPSYPPGGCPNHGTGRVFGTKFYFTDVSAGWQAGHGGPGLNTNCIGIKIISWSSTSVSFKFGSSFGSGTWVLNAGDSYAVTLRGVTASGTVAFS
jgi:hypothetical protein